MIDFLLFRRMLTPILIQIIFWLAILAVVITGISNLIKGDIFLGFQVLILGPILTRIVCELFILFFRMNETLTDIEHKLNKLK